LGGLNLADTLHLAQFMDSNSRQPWESICFCKQQLGQLQDIIIAMATTDDNGQQLSG